MKVETAVAITAVMTVLTAGIGLWFAYQQMKRELPRLAVAPRNITESSGK
jgi:hypothetical protein